MPDRERERREWEQLQAEADIEKKLNKAIDLSYNHIMSSAQVLDNLNSNVQSIRKTLSGNGDPSNSLIARMEDLEEELSDTKAEVKKVCSLLIGDIEKGGSIPSLLERVRRSESVANAAIKLSWLVIAAFVTQIILQILQLI